MNKIFAYLFAAFFMLAGTGYNLVSYCCSLCAEVGIKDVAEMSCNTAHLETGSCCSNEVSHTENKHLTCTDGINHSNDCHLTRLKTDIPVLQIKDNHHIQSTLVMIFAVVNTVFLTEQYAVNTSTYAIPPNHPPSKGRMVLLIKSVLII